MNISATEIQSPAQIVKSSGQQELSELLIQPRRGWIAIDWKELFRFRELLFFLVWRDVKVRYKQTVLGVAWAVLQPLLSMVIFTVIFGNFADMKGKLPPGLQHAYGVFVFAGLLPWQLFAGGLTNGGLSLVSQQNLLTKIYFPRLFVPTASVGGALVDMAVAMGVMAVLMLWYGVIPYWGIVFLPALVLLTIIASLGVAYTLSAMTVTYRDFRFVVPFMTQILMWISFVAYPKEIIGDSKWEYLLALNPMFGIISGYRAAIFGDELAADFKWSVLGISSAVAVGLLIFGLFYFRKTERRFADIA